MRPMRYREQSERTLRSKLSPRLDLDDLFAPLAESVDRSITERSKIAVFGAGSGGQQVLRTLAAAGVGFFVVADQDVIELRNIATSSLRHADARKPKVRVARREVRAINPYAKVQAVCARDDQIELNELVGIISDAALVLQLTDDVGAAIRLNALGVQLGRDVLHAGTHPGNTSYELIGTLCPLNHPRVGCYRCFARMRCDCFEESGDPIPQSFPSFRASAEERNAKIATIALGLLHHRAGSSLPIAQWGAAFEAWPCWVGRLLPDVLCGSGQLFEGAPPDIHFGMRAAYGDPLPPGWSCPVCGRKSGS